MIELTMTSLSSACAIQLHTPADRAFFFFNDTAPTEIYTLSLHDALPISVDNLVAREAGLLATLWDPVDATGLGFRVARSEEHTSELQSQSNLVCRLLLEKKKKHTRPHRV